MDFIFSSVYKDLARWWRDRMAILIWLGIPFLIGGLISTIASGGDTAGPTGVLLISDQDDSLISGFVSGAYSQGQLGELISVEKVSAEEGEQRINNGEASAYLLIPEGFGGALLNNKPVTLTLKTNPSQTILPRIIKDVTEILMDAGFYLHEAFAEEIALVTGSEESGEAADAMTAAVAVAIQDKFESIGPMIDPPIINIEIVPLPPAEPLPPIAVLFLPGIVLMAILFASNGLAADYWEERETGTLRRLVSAPGKLSGFVAGKALAALVVMGFMAAITLTAGFLYSDLEWRRFLPSLVWVSVAGVGLFAWFAALQMLFSDRKAANLITSIMLFPLLMAGGSFFPFAAMPDWMANIGRMSPNGFVADRLTTELTAAASWSFDTQSWLILLAMTISGLALSTLRLRTGFARR
jgi:ABC-type Na+ efflux pump permease subunit